jgi:hypothetical protein
LENINIKMKKLIILALVNSFFQNKIKAIPQSGTATTTRYWDCSGGACGAGYGNPKEPTFCESNAMFVAPKGNKYKAIYYGTAAISKALGGGNW